MPVVMDASALLTTAADESHDPRASVARAVIPELADRFGLVAPDILAYEVANVVHRKAPQAFGPTLAARQGVVGLLLLPVTLVPPGAASIARAGALAERHALSAHDAAYLELAARDDESVLVTEDTTLANAAAKVLGRTRTFDLRGAQKAMGEGKL